MSESAALKYNSPGWLRNQRFDNSFIGGVALVALLSGFAVVSNPKLFPIIFIADLWLLGYHHVIATYTRIAFDINSVREYKFYLFVLPVIVFAGTFTLAWVMGIWVVTTVYLYWQWFHYSRQSWGVSQSYRGKSAGLVNDGPLFARLSFYLVPLWGILYRSWQAPNEFLFIELRVIPVPELLVDVVGVLAAASVIVWSYTRILAWQRGQLPIAHTYYMVSHYVVFFVGYRLIEDITFGWLVINVWHNAQYVMFVWLFNVNRYREGLDGKARFLSAISQPNKILTYFSICLAISTAVYGAIYIYLTSYDHLLVGVPLAVLIYQTINFHHYIVDSVIWKMRKKNMQKTMGLTKG